MPKIGLLAFTAAAIAVAGVSYAADKIMLACSDLVTDEVYSFVIDLDRKIVSTSIGEDIPITTVTDSEIWFTLNDPELTSHWNGTIDRITGQGSLTHMIFDPTFSSASQPSRARATQSQIRARPLSNAKCK